MLIAIIGGLSLPAEEHSANKDISIARSSSDVEAVLERWENKYECSKRPSISWLISHYNRLKKLDAGNELQKLVLEIQIYDSTFQKGDQHIVVR